MLKISKSLELPTDFATQTVAILARKRVGKTYTASVLAEECCEAKIPFVVLDPTGAWYGLRSSKDGKHAGYPVIIIGGAHGDIPLEFSAGKMIAEFIVENPGFYVIDLSGSDSDAEQDRFATAFAQRLYRLKERHRDPLHLFVDEADSFAPQNPFPGQRPMLGAFEAIVRRGGIRGLGITLITQRAAVLNKNVLTQAEVLITLQTTGPQDIKAVDDWVKLNASSEQREEFISSLASLGQGEAWVWSPSWLEIFKKVKIRERHTFNSSATPKVGEKKIEPAKLADVDLDALRERMEATIEKVKAEDPKLLRKKISELEHQLKAPAPVAAAVEPKEIPVVFGDDLEILKQFPGELREQIQKYVETAKNQLNEALDRWERMANGLADKVLAKIPVAEPKTMAAAAGLVRGSNIRESYPAKPTIAVHSAHQSEVSANGPIPPGERKILTAIAQYSDRGGADREQVGLLTGYKATSRNEYIKRLKSSGYVEDRDKVLYVTPAGVVALGDFEPLPTGQALQSYWLQRLPPGEARILNVVLVNYPAYVGREFISSQTDYKATSRNEYIKRLKTKKLVETNSEGVKASDLLF